MTTPRKGPVPLSQADEVWNLVYRFLRHWPVVLLVSVLGVVGGVVYSRQYRPVFHSEAQVRVGDELDARSVPGQREDPSEMMDLPDTLASAFRARVLVDAKLKPMVAELAADPGLRQLSELSTTGGQEELIGHIKRLVQVDAVTRRVYRLSYDAKDPELAQRVVQGLTEIGVADVIAQRNKSAERARAFLTEETDRSRQRMLFAESEVVQFVRSHPKLLVTMSGSDRSKLGLGAADKLLVSARSRREQAPLKALEASSSPEVRALLSERAQQEATVAQFESAQRFDPLQQKLNELDRVQQSISELKSQHYTPEYPEYRRLTGDAERLQGDIRDIRRGKRDPKLADDMLAVDSAKAKIVAIDKQVALQRRRAIGGGSLLSADDQALSAEAVYARLYRELETSRAAYEKLRERELDAQINEQLAKVKGNPAARVEDPATRPSGPRGVSRKMMTALCIALGLLAGLLAGAGRALTDARIYTVFDLSRSSRLPVLGRLPPSDHKPGWTSLDLPEVVLPPEPQTAPTRSYESRIVWPRQVLSLPSKSSTPQLAAVSSTHSAHSTSSAMPAGSRKSSASRKSPVSHKSPPSGEYMIVAREPPPGPAIPDSQVSNFAASPSSGSHSSQESAIVKWRAAASQKSGALHLSALGYQVRLGALPKPPPEQLVLLSAPDGARAEQYRLLRLRLQEQGDPRVLVIASSRPGEGKTLCSINLAMAYAEGGGPKVVLLDAHLGSAQLSTLLGVPARGQASVATQAPPASDPRSAPHDAVINVPADGLGDHGDPFGHASGDLRSGSPEVWQYLPNLFLVPASALGAKTQRTAILSSPEFAGLLADLREAFDYVIIDVPAISEAADAKLVLRHADAGILLVRAHKTTSSVVSSALDRLGRNTVSGAVLNVFS